MRGAVLLGVALLFSAHCASEPEVIEEAASDDPGAVSTTRLTQPRTVPWVTILLTANGGSQSEIGSGMPVLVRASLESELDDTEAAALPLAQLAAAGPGAVLGADSEPSWRALPVAAGGRELAWVIDPPPPPGTYIVTAGDLAEQIATISGGRDVRAVPVRLEITDAPAPPEAVVTIRRQIAALEDPARWLSLIREAVATSPERVELRLELSDALVATGDLDGAERTLHELLALVPDDAEAPHALVHRLGWIEELRAR